MGLAEHHPATSAAAERLRRGRPALARSFRLHRLRGPFCLQGWCQQCPVARPGGGVELACMVPADRQPPRRTRPDPLRPLGAVAERLPPWFYERLLRPAFLRQAYLRALRRLSAAASLPDRPAERPSPQAAREIGCEVLVVGGGPSGMAAALELARAGRQVLLVQAGWLGGTGMVLPWMRDATLRIAEELPRSGVTALERTRLLGLYPEEEITAAVGPDGPVILRFETLVVATGAYDRPLAYSGNDLPGTVGVRAFERLLAAGPLPAGLEIGVFAAPGEAARAVRAADAAGVRISWLAGPGDLPPADGAEPLPAVRLAKAGGRARVRWAEVEPGGRRRCDLLVIGFTQPTYELQALAGGRLAVAGEPAVITWEARADLPLLVVGEAAGHVDPQEAAAAAVRAAGGRDTAALLPPPPLPPPSVRAPDAFVCFCEDVRVRDVEGAIDAGFAHPELVKRRTGVGTGPCQGKLCLAEMAAILRDQGLDAGLPTVRPPVSPVSLAELAAGAR